MKLVTITEENHGLIGVALNRKSAFQFLVKHNWLHFALDYYLFDHWYSRLGFSADRSNLHCLFHAGSHFCRHRLPVGRQRRRGWLCHGRSSNRYHAIHCRAHRGRYLLIGRIAGLYGVNDFSGYSQQKCHKRHLLVHQANRC